MKDEIIDIPGVHIGRLNSMNLLHQIVETTGSGSEVYIFSYSITDGWMRQLQKLRADFNLSKIYLILNYDVMIRHREKLVQLQLTADEIYLTDSHAKVYFSVNGKNKVAIITSANATNNYRTECCYATNRTKDIQQIESDIRGIIQSAYRVE